MGFSHDSTLLSQGYIFEMVLNVEIVGRVYIPKVGVGLGQASNCPASSRQ